MAETKKKLLRLGGQTFARLIRHVASSSKIIHEPPDLMDRLREYHPCIVACWHGQFMMVATLRPENVKIAAMVARHGDAEIISETLQAMDVQLIRGAGAGWRKRDRGGAAALRSSLQALADGASLVMTADVPPGPARVAGAGIITIARMSGRLIVPVALATKHFASFDTWSRLTINLPYSRLASVVGDPIEVPSKADADMLELKRLELETVLNAATIRAYELAEGDISRATPLDVLAASSPPAPGLALKTYRAATAALRPAVPVLLNMRGQQGKEDPSRRGERLGFAGQPRPEGQVVWVHAASVGETNAILPLIESLLDANPHIHVLLTTGTKTSAEVAASRLPSRALHQYIPLDVPQYVEPFSRSLETLALDLHRIRYLAEPYSRNLGAADSARARQCADVASQYQPLAEVCGHWPSALFALCSCARTEFASCAGHQAARRSQCHYRGQSQNRFSTSSRRRGRARRAEKCCWSAPFVPGCEHASRRRHRDRGSAFADAARDRRAFDDHRAASPRARRGSCGASLGGLGLRTQLRTRSSTPETIRRSTSPTRSASSEPFIRSRPCPSSADRSSNMAAKIP